MQAATKNQGWIGRLGQLEFYLSVVGADKDKDGKYLIRGEVSTFLGMDGENADAVVRPGAEYFVDGAPKDLVSGLASTSYGTTVAVY